MDFGRNVDCEATMARLARLILYAIAVGGALALLCACAQQAQPTAMPEGVRPSGETAVPTRLAVSTTLPSPTPSTEPAGEPASHTLTISDTASSTADLVMQVSPGETGVYTLMVHNLGPDPATGIVLADLLPGSVTPLWTEPAQPVCRREGREAGCDLGNLQAGDAATVTLDLSISGGENPITGTQLAGMFLTLPVPMCTIEHDPRAPQIICHLDRLQSGAEAQVRVGIDVAPGSVGPLVHTATVAANEADPDGSNNQDTSVLVTGATGPTEAFAVPGTSDLVVQADGPASVTVDQPFTYTYTVTNRGTSDATGVWFVDEVPSDMNLLAYTPGLPLCEQQGDAFTCQLGGIGKGETVTFTLATTGHAGQPLNLELDPLLPGWPICWVVKERTWLHVVQCELGELQPGQATHVQLVLVAIGVQERTSANTATVGPTETDANPMDNTSTMTITIQAGAEPDTP
jgi:uncharacterized repeat protein (TIGR01451 family)